MKFKLIENINISTFFFATDHEFMSPFEPSEEGIHLEDNLEVLNRCISGLRSDKKYIYSINTNLVIKPLVINTDICLWSGKNIANLFLAKLDNTFYEECFDGQGDIPPNVILTDTIAESDRDILNQISMSNKFNDIPNFRKIMEFINSKGYNCISYLVWEGNRITDRAYLFDDRFPFNYSSTKLIKESNKGKT